MTAKEHPKSFLRKRPISFPQEAPFFRILHPTRQTMKMRCLHVLLFSILCVFEMHAQDPVFAFAFSNEGKMAEEQDLDFGFKYDVANEILTHLIEAKGDRSKPKPTLVMSTSEQRPAWINLSTAEIHIEEKFYDICASMGADSANALAAVLAHELIHYYENHDWNQHRLAFYTSDVEDRPSMEDHLHLEVQADQLGGFLAQMAGYPAPVVMSAVLPKVYEGYQLSTEKSELYPSLKDRVAIAEKSSAKLIELSALFEMSQYLTATGHYEKAAYYLQHILLKGKFTSRELYNNLGVLYACVATDLFTSKELPYYFPFILDTETRLNKRANPMDRQRILGAAKDAFEQANQLDKDYFPAKINLACVQALLQEYDKAQATLKELVPPTSILKAKKATVQGIIWALQGERKKAKKEFKLAHQLNDDEITSYNLDVISKKEISHAGAPFQSIDCQMGEVNLEQLFSRIMRDEEKASLEVPLSENNYFYTIDKEDSQILIDLLFNDTEDHIFYQKGTHLSVEGTSLRKGQSSEELHSILGEPTKTLQATKGRFRVYLHHQIIIKFDDLDRAQMFILHHEG